MRRKRRLRSVRCPDPSTLTRYWSWPRDSTIVPDLSHLVGLAPCWFCRKARSPIVSGRSGRSGRECSLKDSVVRVIRACRASSLAAHAWRQSGRMFGLENFSRRFAKESASRRG